MNSRQKWKMNTRLCNFNKSHQSHSPLKSCSCQYLLKYKVLPGLWFPFRLGKWESIYQSGKSQKICNTWEKSGNFTQVLIYFLCDFLIELNLFNRVLYLLYL